MIIMQQDLFDLLRQAPAVSQTVGDRIYPLVVPQEVWSSMSEKPCLVYRVSAEDRQPLFCKTDTLRQTFVEVDALAKRYVDCAVLAERVKRTLIDFRGRVGGTWFDAVQWVSGIELTDVEPGLYRTAMTFAIWNRSV